MSARIDRENSIFESFGSFREFFAPWQFAMMSIVTRWVILYKLTAFGRVFHDS
jgi:hypothetical protein